MKKVLVIAIALTFVLSVAALAGPGQNPNNKLAIHVKAHPTSCTKGYPTFTSCSSIVFTWQGVPDIDVLPVFYDLTTYQGVEVALSWPEAAWYSGSFIQCKGDVKVGAINHSAVPVNPAHTAAQTNFTAISWTTCQTGVAVAPCYVWLNAPSAGMVCPVADPATGLFGVIDCTPSPGPYEQTPVCVSCAGIFMVGDDPCRPTAVEPSTWGEIKSIFK